MRVFVTLTDKMAHFVVAAAVGKVFALCFDEIQNIILKNMTIKPLADRVLVKPAPADNVLYGKYAGTEVEVDGEKMLIMRQSDVFAVVE